MSRSIADDMVLSTVKIVTYAGGRETGSGTGFFWQTPVGADRLVISLVTNKHVIVGADFYVIYMHERDPGNPLQPSGRVIQLTVELVPSGTMAHPDPGVDLVAMNVTALINQAEAAGHQLSYRALDASLIPTPDEWERFDTIEELVMIGCPSGIEDEVHRLPLVRRGVSATSLARHYNGREEFMVDLACFPGSSGSPLFLYNPIGGYFDRATGHYSLGQQRIKLVGVLYAGPQMTYDGQIILATPPHVQVNSMMHLGYVLRASRIIEIDRTIQQAVRENPTV